MLYENFIIDNTYQIIKEIGSGGMGVVYHAYHLRLEKDVVLKKFKGDYSNISLLRNEVDILKSLHHPYLPQVYDFISYNNDIYTVIDYIEGYDFEKYLKNGYTFTEGQLIKWLKQLCEVLKYLHSQSPAIIHTDIKPENIIVTAKGNICLIDFGISLSEYDTVKGYSKNYSSPEQYDNVQKICNGYKEYVTKLDARTDIYSLGATFYYLMSGYIPDVENIYQYKLSQMNVPYSDTFVSIIDKAMERNPDDRFLSAGKMYNALTDIVKLDERYKKYVLLQVLTSVVAGIFILSGVAMISFGNNQQLLDDYNNSYNKFLTCYETGDYNTAIDMGKDILNNHKYKSVFDKETQGQILWAIGECFYEKNDYVNAVEYYRHASECAEYLDNPATYYKDYAIALIKNNEFDEATKVLQEASEKYPDSPISYIVNAQMNYQQGNYEEAIQILQGCMDKAMDSENKCSVYILYGDACSKLGKYADAAYAYSIADNTDNSNVTALRKLGNAYMAEANNGSSINMTSLTNAENCYKQIFNKYTPLVEDCVNLSQIYMLKSDYVNAKRVLEQYISNYSEDYRIYIQLAFVCNYSNDTQTAFYCEKAKKAFKAATQEEQNSIDVNYLESFKRLYQSCMKQEW